MPDINLTTESTLTTQQPLGTDSLPVEGPDTSPLANLTLRDVSDPSLGLEATAGLTNLIGKAGSDFTITSATREESKGLHGSGSAIDFGVRPEDGKGMMNFFFDDEEGTILSKGGSQYLTDNNAELIDERENPDGAHFHLEFNPKGGANFIDKDGKQSLYAKGKTTSEGYSIYGVQNSFKENPFNLSKDYAKAYNSLLQEGADSIDISQNSEFMKQFGKRGPTAPRTPGGGIDVLNATEQDPVKSEFDTYKADNISSYSLERPDPTAFKGSFLGTKGSYSSRLKARSEAEIRNDYRDLGVSMRPENNFEEAGGNLQSNWTKVGKMLGTFSTSFFQVGGSTAASIAVGIPSAIKNGRFRDVYANPVNSAFEDFIKTSGENNPYYGTAAQKESTLNPNFWTQQLSQGLGFLVGAMATGGAAAELKLGASMFKGLNFLNPKSILRARAAMWRANSLGLSAEKSRRMVDLMGKVSTRSNAANFYGAGIISAVGESTIEANSIYHQSIKHIKELKAGGDKRFAGMSEEEIEEAAASYGNVAFMGNMAVVGASNMLMFKNLFKSGFKNLNSKYLKGMITRDGLKLALKNKSAATSPFRRGATKAGLLFKRPLAEMSEEWAQFAIEKGAHDYFSYGYSPDKKSMADYLEGFVNMAGSFGRGVAKTPTEVEGRQSMILGFLLGFLGEQGGRLNGTPTEVQSWVAKYEATKKVVDDINIMSENGDLFKYVTAMARLEKEELNQLEAIESQDIFSSKIAESNKIFHTLALLQETEQLELIDALLEDVATLSDEEYGKVFELAGYENEKQQAGESQEARDNVTIDKVDVQKQISFLKEKVSDFKKSMVSVREGIDSIAVEIAENYKGDPKYLPAILNHIKNKLAFYSYNTKDLDRRNAQIKTELAAISKGHLNPDALNTLEVAKDPEKGESLYDKAAAMYKEQATKWEESSEAPNAVDKVKALNLYMDAIRMNEALRDFRKLVNGIYTDPSAEVKDVLDNIQETIEDTPIGTEVKKIVETGKSQEEIDEELKRQQANKEGENPEPPPVHKTGMSPDASDLADEHGITDFSLIDATGYPDKDGNPTISVEDIENYIKKNNLTPKAKGPAIIEKLRGNRNFIKYNKVGDVLVFNGKGYLKSSLEDKGDHYVHNGTTILLKDHAQEAENEQFYVNTKTGQVYTRVTTAISNSSPKDNVVLSNSKIIGTAIDEFVRDFFNGTLKPFSKYTFAEQSKISAFHKHLIGVKQDYEAKGETIYADDLILYNDDLGIAGTVDLISVDKSGKVRIYDMKTMRGNQLIEKHGGGVNKGKTKYDHPYNKGEDTNRVKHQKQLSLYRILLNNTEGVTAVELEVWAIPVMYSRTKPVKSTYKLPSENSPMRIIPVEPLDEVHTPRGNTEIAKLNAKSKANPTSPAESAENTTTATEEQAPIPNNEEDDSSNIQNQVGNENSPGTMLTNILKAAWMSVRNRYQGAVGKDHVTSDFLESHLTGDMKGTAVHFEFDLEYMSKKKATSRIARKIQNKEELTDEELAIVAIKGTLQVDNEEGPVTVYVHEKGFIKKRMAPKDHEQAASELAAFRRAIYDSYLAGKVPTTTIKRMSGGHIMTRTNKDGSYSQHNPLDVINGGYKALRSTPMKLVTNNNTEFNNEHKRADEDLGTFVGSRKTNGAVYTIIKMANGKPFPLRLFINNLNQDMAEVIYDIYLGKASGKIKALNAKVTEADLAAWSLKSDRAKAFVDFLNGRGRTTYSNVLSLLSYEGNSPKFKFDTQTKQLVLGDKRISMEDISTRKDEIISWLKDNKRYNVKMSEANSHSNYAYNNWLAEHGIVYTNAYAAQKTQTAFKQPSLTFGPIESQDRVTPPNKTTPEEKPPAASEESTEEGIQSFINNAEVIDPLEAEAEEAVESEAKEMSLAEMEEEAGDFLDSFFPPLSSSTSESVENEDTEANAIASKMMSEYESAEEIDLSLFNNEDTDENDTKDTCNPNSPF